MVKINMTESIKTKNKFHPVRSIFPLSNSFKIMSNIDSRLLWPRTRWM